MLGLFQKLSYFNICFCIKYVIDFEVSFALLFIPVCYLWIKPKMSMNDSSSAKILDLLI